MPEETYSDRPDFVPEFEGEAVEEVMSSRDLARAGQGDDLIAATPRLFEDDQLLHAEGLAELQAMLTEAGVDIHNAEDVLGDGFELISGMDKMRLVDKPLFFIQWVFMNSQKFGEMVAIHAVEITGPGDKDIRKVKIIDFSGKSGIRVDLANYSNTYDKFGGLYLRKGLRASTYNFKSIDPSGQEVFKPATTFYLNYTVG